MDYSIKKFNYFDFAPFFKLEPGVINANYTLRNFIP